MNRGISFLGGLMEKIKSQKKVSILVVMGIFLLCVIFSVVNWKKKKAEEAVIQANLAKLEDMASQGLERTEEELRSLKQEESEAEAAKQPVQQEGAGEDFQARDIVALRQSFQDCMILGDSITEGLISYQILDGSMVAYARGKSVGENDDLIQKAVENKPLKVFLAFGMNDLGYYQGNVESFIEEYRRDVDTLQKEIPDVDIYINGILPITEEAIKNNSYLAHYQEFNQALEALCQEKGLTYVDNSFILESHPEYHAGDGLHVSKSYYPLWLTNMAIKAGI